MQPRETQRQRLLGLIDAVRGENYLSCVVIFPRWTKRWAHTFISPLLLLFFSRTLMNVSWLSQSKIDEVRRQTYPSGLQGWCDPSVPWIVSSRCSLRRRRAVRTENGHGWCARTLAYWCLCRNTAADYTSSYLLPLPLATPRSSPVQLCTF